MGANINVIRHSLYLRSATAFDDIVVNKTEEGLCRKNNLKVSVHDSVLNLTVKNRTAILYSQQQL